MLWMTEAKPGQVYDRKLIRRMLNLPNLLVLFCDFLILIFTITGASLARPYLTKVGIDKYINGVVKVP